MKNLLWRRPVRLQHFGSWAESLTQQLKDASCQAAKDQNRPIVYVPSSDTDQDQLASQIAAKEGITNGLVAILTGVEPGMSFDIYRNKTRRSWI